MRKFKITDLANPPHDLFTLLDLPLQIEMMDEEFDAIADMTVGQELDIAEYHFVRVE